MYIYIYKHTYIHTCIYILHVCMHIRTYTYMYIQINMHIYIYTYIFVYIYTYKYIYIYIYVCMCVCVYMYIHTHIHEYVYNHISCITRTTRVHQWESTCRITDSVSRAKSRTRHPLAPIFCLDNQNASIRAQADNEMFEIWFRKRVCKYSYICMHVVYTHIYQCCVRFRNRHSCKMYLTSMSSTSGMVLLLLAGPSLSKSPTLILPLGAHARTRTSKYPLMWASGEPKKAVRGLSTPAATCCTVNPSASTRSPVLDHSVQRWCMSMMYALLA